MALRAKALTAILLAVVFLSLTMAPTWSMAFLILFGMIAPAVVAAGKKMRRNPALAADAPALDVDAVALDVDALAPEVDTAGKTRRKPESSSISSSSSGIEYEVFLNFSGPDVCTRLADFLYTALKSVGIKVFKDDDLRVGEEIGPEIKEAIKQSRISIAILSKNYASDKWCLEELVQMWECRKTNGQIIIPIFYDISPSDVKNQVGDFGSSFNLLGIDRVDSNIIETWKEVLRQIGRLKGFSPRSLNGCLKGHDGQLVKEVVAGVVHLLKKDGQIVTDKLVGIDSRVRKMMTKLGVAYSEGQAIEVQGEQVRVVGIWGVPGVGKTTLAKVAFNKMRKLFDACCFLEDISLEEVQYSLHMLIADLQKRKLAPLGSSSEGTKEIASLCRNAKVLIVLDDVDNNKQIKALAGKLTWFGPGSRIIVTTNDRKVLDAFDVGADDGGAIEEHEVKPMGRVHAHKLFCRHAFQGASAAAVSEYFDLSIKIAKAIGGLPSDIVDHASSLHRNTNIDTWKSTLELLKKHPKNRVQGSELGNSIEDNLLTSPIQESSIN